MQLIFKFRSVMKETKAFGLDIKTISKEINQYFPTAIDPPVPLRVALRNNSPTLPDSTLPVESDDVMEVVFEEEDVFYDFNDEETLIEVIQFF